GYGRSRTYDFLRVARALPGLPGLERAFAEGRLSYEAVSLVTRVASAETELEWIELAGSRGPRALELEVRDAALKGRRRPRRKEEGLPRLAVRVAFALLPEEHDILEKALRKAAFEARERTGKERLEPKEALLELARSVLETEPQGSPEGAPQGSPGRKPREEPAYTVLYQRCPDCRKAHLPAPEGLVSIPGEVVDRVEGKARRVEITPEEEEQRAGGIDAPVSGPPKTHTASLRRKILLRDGLVCVNPGCRRRLGLHAHHLELRCEGGLTGLLYECAVCERCHAAVHAGRLRVEGDPTTGLRWIAASEEEPLDLSRELEALAAARELRVELPRGAESRDLDSQGGRTDADPLERRVTEALLRLGCARSEARERVGRAREALAASGASPAAGDLLKAALRQ
ncbi:MAG: hypothetical protein HY721_30560, partial [Planctomycetes bacterium]|nr:hypothetical protein [Planctomycetota bacterium]